MGAFESGIQRREKGWKWRLLSTSLNITTRI
jgi:hypothetical protein